MSIVVLSEEVKLTGEIVTGALIAGGSKASIRLFRDIMGFKSNALRDREELDKRDNQKNSDQRNTGEDS